MSGTKVTISHNDWRSREESNSRQLILVFPKHSGLQGSPVGKSLAAVLGEFTRRNEGTRRVLTGPGRYIWELDSFFRKQAASFRGLPLSMAPSNGALSGRR